MTPDERRDESTAGETRGEATMGEDRTVTADETAGGRSGRDGWFVSAAAAVGDLGNPFYDEERRRDVWNEASAVGFQLMLILGLAATAGFLLVGGAAAMPYAQVMVGVIGLASLITIGYAVRLGVNPAEATRVNRWRLVLVLVLLALVVIGMLRATRMEPDTVWGMATGLLTVVVFGGLLSVWWRRRERRRADPADG